MHFFVKIFICVPFLHSFIPHKWLSYIVFFFSLTCRYPNNEHENDSANGQGFDFEKIVYAGELDNEGDMEDNDLPLDLLRLVEQDERQILPHQKITKAVNLGTEEGKRKVKMGTTLSLTTKNDLIDLL